MTVMPLLQNVKVSRMLDGE